MCRPDSWRSHCRRPCRAWSPGGPLPTVMSTLTPGAADNGRLNAIIINAAVAATKYRLTFCLISSPYEVAGQVSLGASGRANSQKVTNHYA